MSELMIANVVDESESIGNLRLVPKLTPEEEIEFSLRTAKEDSDREEGMSKKDEAPKEFSFDTDVDLELMKVMESEPLSYYFNKKEVPDSILRPYLPDLKRRWFYLEKRVKHIEDRMWLIDRPDRSIEEDRFEILSELLDKACQGFEIWDEHEVHNIRLGHRVVLETRLMNLIKTKFDLIERIIDEFDKLKGDQDGANNEREFLRWEIRHCDLEFTEIHERFLKSFLEMEW